VGVAGVLAVTATAAAAGATGAALPAGRVFVPVFVGLLGGLATLAVARSRRAGHAGPGPAVAGLGLAGVAACVAFLGYYLAEFPTYHRARLHAWTLVSLPPVTAVVLAVVLAGCLWLALRPPRWLLGDRHARRFGVGMAVALVAGFVLTSRQELRGLPGGTGMMDYSLTGLILWVTGSAVAAAVGRSFRSGLWACAWAAVAGRAAAGRRLAGRGAALVSAGSRDAPGRGRGDRGGRQPGRRGLVDPAVPAGVGPALGRARRGRRERACAPPPGPRARRSRLDDLNGAPAALSRRIDPTKPQKRPLPALIDRHCQTRIWPHFVMETGPADVPVARATLDRMPPGRGPNDWPVWANEPVVIVDYDLGWALQAAQERRRLLGPVAGGRRLPRGQHRDHASDGQADH
jgi:hypothetical protein